MEPNIYGLGSRAEGSMGFWVWGVGAGLGAGLGRRSVQDLGLTA